MASIPREKIEEILQRTDIVHVVQRYVSLKKSGAGFVGLCPFHTDRKPSFSVTPAMGIYKCFACGEGGDVISFLRKIEGWSFMETIKRLAQDAGVEIVQGTRQDQEAEQKRRKGREIYTDILASAASFYQEQLKTKSGEVARFYLKERGVTSEVAAAFGLGYAPNEWSSLCDALGKKGYPGSYLERAGLVSKRSTGGFYDRFRHRVMFPVDDIWNHTLAFGGRLLGTDTNAPKYMNSPETPYYTKGDQLYGLHVTKAGIRKAGYAVLVEGNFDVVTLYGHGIDMVVAPMGTALTLSQSKLLARYARTVYVLFDGDAAGEGATLKAIGPLTQAGIDARVVRLDVTDDPDSFVRQNGPDALLRKIEKGGSLLNWAVERVLPKTEKGTPQERLRALEEAVKVLQGVPNVDTVALYQTELARRLDLTLPVVKKYFQSPEKMRAVVEERVLMNLSSASIKERGLLRAALERPKLLQFFIAEQHDLLFEDQRIGELCRKLAQYQAARELAEAGPDVDRARDRNRWDIGLFKISLDDPTEVEIIETVLTDKEVGWDDSVKEGEEVGEQTIQRYYDDCLANIKASWADRLIQRLQLELTEVNSQEDPDRFRELIEQMQTLSQFRTSLGDRSGSK